MTKREAIVQIQELYRVLNAGGTEYAMPWVGSDAPLLCRHLDAMLHDMADQRIITPRERQEIYDTM